MAVFLKRFGQLEAKVEQHEMKINSQQVEIDQLKKKNSDLEEKNHELKKHDEISPSSSLARSCFEYKATINPNAQSGVFTIDPDGQTGGDPPIQVYCNMTTRNNGLIVLMMQFR